MAGAGIGADVFKGDRLISWKEVAAHLGCSVATAQRWERQEGLPVHRHVHQKLGSIIAFRSEIDRWASERGRRSPSSASEPRRVSLAVLPFANYTGDARKEYLCDGVTEELITELGRRFSDRLKLIARTSVMQFKCTHEPVDRIARQLEVGHIIEGSISAAGAEFRVSAQLIEAAGQRHIWADSFPGKLRDLFAIAKAIASHCAERLDLTTADAGLLQQRVVISAAYDHYLQARFHWFQLTRDAIDRALHHYEQALRHDPNFGAAYAGVSAVWQVRGDSGYVAPAEAYPYARDAASRALALSPDSAFVRGVYAYLRFEYEWDMEGALAEGERALALNGSDVNVHLLLWDCHVSARRFREAGEHIEACLKLDPYNPFFKCFYGWHLLFAERFEESVQPLRKAISDQPSLSAARLGLWGAFYRRGMHAQAIKEACEFFMSRGEPDIADTLAREYRRHEYRTAMRMAADELAAKAKREHVGALRVARLYSHANDANAALEWLLRALGERTPALKHLAVGWDWVCLRENAQFRRILAKVNLRIE